MSKDPMTLEQLAARLHEASELPPRLRYCEGTDPGQNDQVFSKRVFFSSNELMLELTIPAEAIRSTLESMKYVPVAEQHVPDGWGRNYNSTYYKLTESVSTDVAVTSDVEPS